MNINKLVATAIIICAPFSAVAEPTSCYVGELASHRPAVLEAVILLIDTSSDATAVKQNVLDVVKAIPDKHNRQVVVLSFAGHAAGESLKVEFESLIEPPTADQQVIDNTVIKTFKAHQKCIREQHQQARQGLLATMQRLLSTMPVATARSEIAYALSSALQSYALPGRNVILLHLSDGLQHAQGGRSFYGANKQPRKIETAIELRAFAKDAATAPRAKLPGTYISVLWWGMLAMPAPAKVTGKPVYLNTATIGAFKEFWEQYARSIGADRVQIGTPNLLNPDLSIPAKQPM